MCKNRKNKSGKTASSLGATATFVQKINERILLVDDQLDVIDVEQRMIQRMGYRVTSRSGSLEALKTFQTDPDSFDLVVTDLTMPFMTGIELAQKLKLIKPDIPVILCTGFDTLKSKEIIMSHGIDVIVIKPIFITAISYAIRDVLDK